MRARSTGSLRRQLVVLSASVTAFASLLLTLLVQLLLAQTSANAIDRVLEERADAVISSAQGASSATRLVVPDTSLEAGVAVYDDTGRLVGGNAPSASAQEYDELSATQRLQTVKLHEASLIRAQPFTLATGPSGVVVVTERVAPYEETEHTALLVSALTGMLAVLASAALAAWVSRRALAPVVAMAATADDWSEHDLSRRFDLGPPANEISTLALTLDTLLDKVAAAIHSEQRLTSELAHELRTPLTSVQGTADLMAMRPDLGPELREDVEAVRAGARRMGETITALLELARSTANVVAAGSCDLREMLDDVLVDLGEHGAEIVVDVPADVRLGLPLALARRAVGPVVDNAARLADTVRLSVVEHGHPGYVVLAVDDDGAGVAEHLRERIFEPGETTGSGSGLGLPLARRIARSAGGDVRLVDQVPDPDHQSCTRFVIELPRG